VRLGFSPLSLFFLTDLFSGGVDLFGRTRGWGPGFKGAAGEAMTWRTETRLRLPVCAERYPTCPTAVWSPMRNGRATLSWPVVPWRGVLRSVAKPLMTEDGMGGLGI